MGTIGFPSCTIATHLHFEVYRRDERGWLLVDPMGWASERPDPLVGNNGNPEGTFLFLDFPEQGVPARCDLVWTSERVDWKGKDGKVGDTGI